MVGKTGRGKRSKLAYTIVARFRDVNTPRWIEKVATEEWAAWTVGDIAAKLAGLRSIAILTPEGDKVIFYGDGEYAFTIPAATFGGPA